MKMSSQHSLVISLLAVFILCYFQYHNHLRIKKLEERVENICTSSHDEIDDTVTERNPDTLESGRVLQVVGVVGNGIADDTRAIQRAINKAAKNKRDGVVILPKGTFKTTKPLKLKGGVTLRGNGYGSSPLALQFDAGGTVIAYCGEDYAIEVVGHAASLENIAVYDWQYPEGSDCENIKAAGGIKIQADNRLVESVTMSNVLIYWFMGGTALTLEARNAGGIGYASFKDMRIRHAKVGIHMVAVNEDSFVNSNVFHDGAISGAITDVGILASGPGACNDNQFQSMVIEPPSTSIAHVHVSGSKTNVIMDKVRLEGTQMSHDQPLVIVEDDSYGNIMNGLLGHTFVQADLNRNPGIQFASNKMTGINPSFNNLFWNSAFHGFNVDSQIVPGWTFSGDNFSIQHVSEEEALYPGHYIISIDKTTSSTLQLSPSSLPSSAVNSFCTFGIYAKTSSANSIIAAMRHASGSIISSSPHTGSGKWEFIGMSSLFDQTTGPEPYFSITGDVTISTPTFSYGHGQANPASEFLSSSGAKMSGLLSFNMIEVSPPADGGFWTLPQDGNLFKINSLPESGTAPCSTSYTYITRINHSGSDRFEAGAVITLLFPPCGDCVNCLGLTNSAYLNLLGGSGFAPSSTATQSSITLVSSGLGTWTEVSRNTL